MAVTAEDCSLALRKYSSSLTWFWSSADCWDGRTLTQRAACSFRESLMLNEMEFKWGEGGVAGVSSVVHPVWCCLLCDKMIKSI